jgi:hypothetical protein
MSRVRIFRRGGSRVSHEVTAILVQSQNGSHVSCSPYASSVEQIYVQFQSDGEGLYIPIRNRA